MFLGTLIALVVADGLITKFLVSGAIRTWGESLPANSGRRRYVPGNKAGRRIFVRTDFMGYVQAPSQGIRHNQFVLHDNLHNHSLLACTHILCCQSARNYQTFGHFGFKTVNPDPIHEVDNSHRGQFIQPKYIVLLCVCRDGMADTRNTGRKEGKRLSTTRPEVLELKKQ